MTEQAISPLRRRMIEDMTIRKFAQKTQHDYVQRVKDFARHRPIRAPPRGFVPWRFSDAGRRACGNVRGGRHPKTFTGARLRDLMRWATTGLTGTLTALRIRANTLRRCR